MITWIIRIIRIISPSGLLQSTARGGVVLRGTPPRSFSLQPGPRRAESTPRLHR